MPCVSTRGQAPPVSLERGRARAASRPTAASTCPPTIERRPDAWWSALRGKSFQDVAIAMARELAGDEFDAATLERADARRARISRSASSSSTTGLGVLELFHGPTFAFKDVGARMLARLAGASSPSDGRESPLTVLVATSGDTGSAVAHAFLGVAGTRVVVLYPEGQVSAVQEAQFTTLGGNVTAVAVEGTFDDCQRLAKEAFADRAAAVARAADLGQLDQPRPAAAADVLLRVRGAAVPSRHTPLVISVPSGNFGNLTAGVMAWKMGAPIDGFVAPTTINDTVPRYFASGPGRAAAVGADAGQRHGRRQSQQPRAPAVAVRRRPARRCARSISTERRTPTTRCAARSPSCIRQYGYVADPHTAIGYLGAAALARGAPAHRAHCSWPPRIPRSSVRWSSRSIGKPVPLPDALAATLARTKAVATHRSDAWQTLSKLL